MFYAHNYSTAFVTLNLFHISVEASFKFSIVVLQQQ